MFLPQPHEETDKMIISCQRTLPTSALYFFNRDYCILITTLLFLLGKTVIGVYFGQAAPASVYGGASSVVLILLWVYYTGLCINDITPKENLIIK